MTEQGKLTDAERVLLRLAVTAHPSGIDRSEHVVLTVEAIVGVRVEQALAPVRALAEDGLLEQQIAMGWTCDHDFRGASCSWCFANIDRSAAIVRAQLRAALGDEATRG